MYNERTVDLTLNCEQAHEIKLALKERIERLQRMQERCWECEIETENPIFKKAYKESGEELGEWIEHVSAVLEHVEINTGEIKP